MPGANSTAASEQEAAVVILSGEHKGWTFWLRATNLWAGTILAALAVIGLLIWGDPVKHQTLQLLSMMVAGLFMGSALMNGRLQEALKDKAYYRAELNRVTAVKAQLEARGLTERQSSASIDDSKSKKPKNKPRR